MSEDTKYCTLPGQEAIFLSNTIGHSCLIGETPRTVPEMFQREAIARGAFTEEQLDELRVKLAQPVKEEDANLPATPPTPPATFTNTDEEDGFPAPPGNQPPLTAEQDRETKIKAAIIEALNVGNPDDFTTGGAPKVEVLKALLGFDVTGPERDSLYAVVKG